MISLTPILLALCVIFLNASAQPSAETVAADLVEINNKGHGHRVVKKTLTVTYEIASPNGNARPVIHVNKQFPAPNLFFDEDDDVEVHLPFFPQREMN